MLSQVDMVLASRAPKRLLFQHIGRFIKKGSPDYLAIEKAYRVARRACKNRMREDGTKAFGHGRTVCLLGVICLHTKDPALIQAKLLHDVVEDINGWTHERIEREFGESVAYYVRWLSKPHPKLFKTKAERDAFYCGTFEDAPRKVMLGKLPDVLHNLRTLFACSLEKQKRIVATARRVYLPLAKKHNILYREILTAIERVEAVWPALEAGRSAKVIPIRHATGAV